MSNGQQKAQQNVERFLSWSTEREYLNDWRPYIYRGKLNRKIIAEECNFAKSVLLQNPTVREALSQLEIKLEKQGLFTTSSPSAIISLPSSIHQPQNNSVLEKRIKELEEKNLLLKAENEKIRMDLKKYELIEQTMLSSGLLPKL